MSPLRHSLLMAGLFLSSWTAVELIAAGVLSRYSPYQVVWVRYAVHTCVILLIWGWRRPAPWRTGRPVYQWLRSMLMLGMPACWVMSMQHGVHPDTLMAVFWTAPLMILVLATFVLREQTPVRLWIAAATACAGALLLFRHALPGSLAVALWPAGMALTFSLYVVMTRSLRAEPLGSNLFYTGFGVLLALTPAMPGLWMTPTAGDFAVMVIVGVLGVGALYSLDRMAAAAPLSACAPSMCMQPVVLVAVTYLLGGAYPGSGTVLGVLLIVGVVWYLWRHQPSLTVGGASPVVGTA